MGETQKVVASQFYIDFVAFSGCCNTVLALIGEMELPSCPQELSERKNWFCVTLKMVDFTDVDHDFAVITLIFYLYGQVTFSTGFEFVSSEAGQRYLLGVVRDRSSVVDVPCSA